MCFARSSLRKLCVSPNALRSTCFAQRASLNTNCVLRQARWPRRSWRSTQLSTLSEARWVKHSISVAKDGQSTQFSLREGKREKTFSATEIPYYLIALLPIGWPIAIFVHLDLHNEIVHDFYIPTPNQCRIRAESTQPGREVKLFARGRVKLFARGRVKLFTSGPC